LLYYLFLYLLGLGDLHSASASELLIRGRDEWTKHFEEMGRENTRQQARDAALEMQKLSVFRGLVEWAGGRRDESQHNWDLTRSANYNLSLVVHSLNAGMGVPVQLVGFDAPMIEETLLKHSSLRVSESDIFRLQYIPLYVPGLVTPGVVANTGTWHIVAGNSA